MTSIRFFRWMIVLTGMVFLSFVSLAQAQETSAEKLDGLGGYPCPSGDFTCVKLSVPLDHFGRNDSQTIEVVFAVLPATGERKGMFVTATGGPGSSGLASADSYTGAFDPSIPEHFDIVFFDQRGIGQSGELQCANAVAAYYQTDARTDTPDGEATLVAAAKTFTEDCIAEMGADPARLPYYGTNQAVEDLETFRQAMGDEKIWLYGESYGTQYAQTYAAAHPDHVAALILDGTVDLTLSGLEYYKQQAQAFNDVLVATLEDCNRKEVCAGDMKGGNALEFYDDMAAELRSAPTSFQFPLPSGVSVERSFSLSDLETAAASYVYSEGGRHLLQRAIAAASRGDLVPLARLTYSALGLDEETLAAVPDPTYSDALFYAVECNDYAYPGDTAEARAENYMRAGDLIDKENPRFSSIFYGDLPCAFWPGVPPAERPAALAGEGFSTLVLGATTDPATPVGNGQSVYSRLSDGYLVTTQGGAHVIFGRGDDCPDVLVTDFLVDGTLPDSREITCQGVVARDYVALAAADAGDYADSLEAMKAAYHEVYYLPEYYYWDVETLTVVGCPYGGTLSFAPSSGGEQFHLSGCAFSQGFAMTGGASNDYESGDFTIDVSITGLQDGKLHYVYDSDGNGHVTGEYGGEGVDIEG